MARLRAILRYGRNLGIDYTAPVRHVNTPLANALEKRATHNRYDRNIWDTWWQINIADGAAKMFERN